MSKKPRVLVCLLSGVERSNWICPDLIANLVQMGRDSRFELVPMLLKDYRPFDAARNHFLKLARDNGATWGVCIDNDNFMPQGTPLDIIAGAGPQQNVIGLRYGVRGPDGGYHMFPPHAPNAKTDGDFEETEAVGGGVLMVHRSVWEKIPDGPWFRFEYGPDANLPQRGEDVSFCNLVRSHGLQVWTVSKVLAGHYKSGDVTALVHTLAHAAKPGMASTLLRKVGLQ